VSARLRIALIGAGGWGEQHARVYASRPDVDFVGIVGRTPERTRARAERYGTRAYTDIDEILAREKPDLVAVCLPNLEHFEPTLHLLESGIPVFVEKPLVFALDQADTLLAAAARRGLFFAIDFNHRYAEPIIRAKGAIEAGDLGQPTFATWRFGGEGRSSHPHANLIETQCHAFDQLEYLVGPIDSVMAQMTDVTAGGYRTLALALHFANGAVGSLLGSYDTSYAYPDTHRLELDGTGGHILVEDTVRRYSYHRIGSEVGEVWQAGYFNDEARDFHRTFDRHVELILQAFRAGAEPPVHARAGRRALRLALAAVESFETGRRIDASEP
jgi:myo-inositol 2-dehydrogenase / D-chiro-inositol 1-dehydrogenase